MASSNLLARLQAAQIDLPHVNATMQGIQWSPQSKAAFLSAKELQRQWAERIQPFAEQLDDYAVEPFVLFTEQLVRIGDQGSHIPNESPESALSRIKQQFLPMSPLLVYALFEARGISGMSLEDFPIKRSAALGEIEKAGSDGNEVIFAALERAKLSIEALVATSSSALSQTAKDAAEDLERTKAAARHISVGSAQTQFNEAAKRLSVQAWTWSAISILLFISLLWLLMWLTNHPPILISAIVQSLNPRSQPLAPQVSIPLLVAASAYFTSIRLALVGVLGVAVAFSLRMTRAYFHMVEHNRHKLRVTNSIEAFVAAVRTEEQKDLVLGKLVESVTSFGDTGILGGQTETPGFPSIVVDSITKNFGKSS